MFAWTWPRRMETVSGSPPSSLTAMAQSRVVLVTEAKNTLATVMEYSVAFAEYLEAVRVLVTGSSIGKYASLLGAYLEGARFSKPSEISSR
jgi:hypothetical protein